MVASHSFFSHYPPFFVISSLSPFSLCHRSRMIKFLQFLMWYFLVFWRCSFFCFSLCFLSSEALYSYPSDYHHREESSARLLEPGLDLKRAPALNMESRLHVDLMGLWLKVSGFGRGSFLSFLKISDLFNWAHFHSQLIGNSYLAGMHEGLLMGWMKVCSEAKM